MKDNIDEITGYNLINPTKQVLKLIPSGENVFHTGMACERRKFT